MAMLDDIRAALPDVAKDIKLNLQAVLTEAGPLTPAQRWGSAVAAAAAARNPRVRRAVVADARAAVDATVVEDALAAAALMGMNNVYYRFRHLIEKPVYSEKPARLRMNRMVKPAGSKLDFELFSLVASAINGCANCLTAHERVLLQGGLSEDQVHDAVRIAATINAAAVSLELAEDARANDDRMAEGVAAGAV
jgi:lipoyl-dependent peroxiredoxin subunit D